MENIIKVNDQNFDEEVLICELPVLVCFITKWCQSCYPTCLVADELSEEYNGRVKFVKVDIEESLKIADIYQITAVPTILVFQDSHATKRLISYRDRGDLKMILDNLAA